MTYNDFKTENSKLYILSITFFALAIPFLLVGRSAIGAALILSLIFFGLSGERQEIFKTYKRYLHHKVTYLWCAVWLTWVPSIFFSLKPVLSFEAWIRTGAFVFLAALLGLVAAHRRSLTLQIFSVALFCALFIAMLAQLYWPELLFFVQFKGGDVLKVPMRLKAPSNVFILTIPLSILAYVILKDKIWRFIICCNIVAPIALTLAISARASLVGVLVLGVVYFSVYCGPFFYRRKFYLLLVVPGFCGLVLAGYSWLKKLEHPYTSLNIEMAYLPAWIIDLHRQSIWRYGYEKFLESPLVGYGLNASNYLPDAHLSISEYFRVPPIRGFDFPQVLPGHPHNWIVELVLDAGLIGAFPTICFVVFIFIYGVKSYWKHMHPALLAFIGVNATFWGIGLFNVSFWSSWWQVSYLSMSFFCLFAYVISAALDEKK